MVFCVHIIFVFLLSQLFNLLLLLELFLSCCNSVISPLRINKGLSYLMCQQTLTGLRNEEKVRYHLHKSPVRFPTQRQSDCWTGWIWLLPTDQSPTPWSMQQWTMTTALSTLREQSPATWASFQSSPLSQSHAPKENPIKWLNYWQQHGQHRKEERGMAAEDRKIRTPGDVVAVMTCTEGAKLNKYLQKWVGIPLSCRSLLP